MLLDNGADAKAKDTAGSVTPLHCAVKGAFKFRWIRDPLEMLLRNGAEIDSLAELQFDWTISIRGTPLAWAAALGQPVEIPQYLVYAGADVESRATRTYGDAYGGERTTTNHLTPLMLACMNGNSQMVAALLDLKASVAEIDSHKDTALGHAVTSGHRDTALTILCYIHNLKVEGIDYQEPLRKAHRRGDSDMIDLLTIASKAPENSDELLSIWVASGGLPESNERRTVSTASAFSMIAGTVTSAFSTTSVRSENGYQDVTPRLDRDPKPLPSETYSKDAMLRLGRDPKPSPSETHSKEPASSQKNLHRPFERIRKLWSGYHE